MATGECAAMARSNREALTSNTLDRKVVLAGVLLWPSWKLPPDGTPAAKIRQMGEIENHWHYTPGQINWSPAAGASRADLRPVWQVAERFTTVNQTYLTDHYGTPLPEVEVDLFRADACRINFDQYDELDEYYTEEWNRVERVKKLKITIKSVSVMDDGDCLGAGELVFRGNVDGQVIPETEEMQLNSGAMEVPLKWLSAGVGVKEINVLDRRTPVKLWFDGWDNDLLRKDSLGMAESQLEWPWPTEKIKGVAGNARYCVHYEVEPTLEQEGERARLVPRCAAEDQRRPIPERMDKARIASTKTDEQGRFQFRNIPPGQYILFLRGRFAFVENTFPGGNPDPVPAADRHRHNGVLVRDLDPFRGAHRLHLRVTIPEADPIRFEARVAGGGLGPFPVVRHHTPVKAKDVNDALIEQLDDYGGLSPLPPDAAEDAARLKEWNRKIPFRFYVLPLVTASNAVQTRNAATAIKRMFGGTLATAQAAVESHPMLHLWPLYRWWCADDFFDVWKNRPPVIAKGEATEDLLKHTLLIRGAAGAELRSMAFDHATWPFRDATDKKRKLGRFIPLGTEGYFSGANPLFDTAVKSKETYGEYALPFVASALRGRNIREIKVRLLMWGSNANFVNVDDDAFDDALRDALIRFKWAYEVFRRRVPSAGNPDSAQCVITSIFDRDTFIALDALRPVITLADAADTDDPKPSCHGRALLHPEGYDRLIVYAVEAIRKRIEALGVAARPAPVATSFHSPFRTLDNNRRVYLGQNNLHWTHASAGGILGVHAAGQLVTPASVRYGVPLGTYSGAADSSHHTTGRAMDFCLDPAHAAGHGNVNDIQRDSNMIVLFGGSRAAHANDRLWVEPRREASAPVVAADNTARTGWGTTNWVHVSTDDISNFEYALTEEDLIGPRWDANILITGTIRQGGVPRLGARVELVDLRNNLLTFTHADRMGRYALRVSGGTIGVNYTVRSRFPDTPTQPYPFQEPLPAAVPVRTAQRVVNVADAGEEVQGVDLNLPP